ncbi:Hypothetical predicted protein [Xyrichtys novacula]|uniref:Uncharacterized protein n=1 Tax=Xyrichtys novacula TaxID=13765 RepID=A0AAV1F743_XYRNO|nr:Hypothetical predicted protein [Xyrichtys novacula]
MFANRRGDLRRLERGISSSPVALSESASFGVFTPPNTQDSREQCILAGSRSSCFALHEEGLHGCWCCCLTQSNTSPLLWSSSAQI